MVKRILNTFLATFILCLALFTPVASAAPDNSFGIPKEILGFPVLFLQTPENTVGFPDNYAGVAIIGTNTPYNSERLHNIPIKAILNALPPNWTVQFAWGTNRTAESIARANERNNEGYRAIIAAKGKLPKLSPLSVNPPETVSNTLDTTYNTFAIIENLDADDYDLVYQSFNCYAPTIGSNQDYYSALVNNVETDGYVFLQAGLEFVYTTGYVVHARAGGSGNPFSLNYTAGHQYSFQIYYSGYSGTWYETAADINTLEADTFTETSVSGTKLRLDHQTSVWWENGNSNSNWYSGFTNPVSTWYAKESTDVDDPQNNLQNWATTNKTAMDTNGQWTTHNMTTGDLANGGTACWYLDKILVHG